MCNYDGQVEVADEGAEVSLTEATVGKDQILHKLLTS